MLRRAMGLLLSWVLAVATVGLLSSGRDDRVQSAHQADPERAVRREFIRLLISWLLLLLLGGAEFAISFLPMARSLRPLVMIPGALMVAVVAVGFMEVGKGPTIVRGFAVAAMFWLIVLLGLGSADPLTRTNYYVPHAPAD